MTPSDYAQRAFRRLVGMSQRDAKSPPPIRYSVGQFNLLIPGDHILPKYQSEFPLYDRFPLTLARHLPPGVVIDVGANVGDSAAAFGDPATNPILCAEPDEALFAFLTDNADAMRRQGLDIQCRQVALGPADARATLRMANSTGAVSLDSSGDVKLMSLDDFVARNVGKNDAIALIKTDTDGFDADVLLSGTHTLKTRQPMLYWENHVTTPAILGAYERLFDALAEIGYDELSVFDNFGNLMLAAATFGDLVSLSKYCRRQLEQDRPTIYYFDVLCSAAASREHHRRAIAAYIDQPVLNPALS